MHSPGPTRCRRARVLLLFLTGVPLHALAQGPSAAADARPARLQQGSVVEPRPNPAGAAVVVPKRVGPGRAAAAPVAGAIAGRVTSAQGEPLAAASVLVVGTQLKASTGTDGRFLISGVPAGTYQVRASVLGYADQTVEGVRVMDGETVTVDIQLQTQAIALKAIVAVGYGTRRKKAPTGSGAAGGRPGATR